MGRIDRLEVENFKSYAGKQTIGPFDSFTCVIGPNGAGKSNVMDAISFVLGMKASGIRAEKLSDLIFHIEGQTKGAPTRASVSLIYVVALNEVEGLDAGDELIFSRTITPAHASVYSVNGNDVSADQYVKGLLEIGIDIKAKNFLVFQSEVDSVARKKPKEMLDFFEVFCGSAELREPCETANQEVEEARREVHSKQALRKLALAEARDTKAAREEADRYEALTSAADDLRLRLVLLKLYYIDSDLTAKDTNLRRAREKLAVAASDEEEVADKQRDTAKAAAAASKTASKKETQLNAKGAQVREAHERVFAAEARSNTLKASVADAGGADKIAAKAVKTIEAEVESLRVEVEELEAEFATKGGGGRVVRGQVLALVVLVQVPNLQRVLLLSHLVMLTVQSMVH